MSTPNIGFVLIRVFIALSVWFCISAVLAESASLAVDPHLIIFDDQTRGKVLRVINLGQRTGVYKMSWIDYTMTGEGRLTAWTEPSRSPWSVQPYVRFSPRRVTLKPGEAQVVRIVLRRSAKEIPAGEYFSHLRVLTITDNLEETLQEKRAAQHKKDEGETSETKLTITAQTAIGIPVVWQHSDDVASVKIEFKYFDPSQNKLQLQLNRFGHLSARGYIHVFHQQGTRRDLLVEPLHTLIYANLSSLKKSLALTKKLPGNGRVVVIYAKSNENVDDIIGQAEIELQALFALKPSIVEMAALKPKAIEQVADNKVQDHAAGLLKPAAAGADNVQVNDHDILNLPANYYTIQILAVRDPTKLALFVKQHQLINTFIKRMRVNNGEVMHVLLLGVYSKSSSAKKILDGLSTKLKVRPWIRTLGSLQPAIKEAKVEL